MQGFYFNAQVLFAAFGPGNVYTIIGHRNAGAGIIEVEPESISRRTGVEPGLVKKTGYGTQFVDRTVGAHQTVGVAEFQEGDGVL